MSDDHFREIEEHHERVTGLEYEASLEDPDRDKYWDALDWIPRSTSFQSATSRVVRTCRRYSAPYALCPRHGT